MLFSDRKEDSEYFKIKCIDTLREYKVLGNIVSPDY